MTAVHLSAIDINCQRDNRSLFSTLCFSLKPGEMKHIQGENGIGKTTLLRCLAGLSKPYSGEINWLGNNINDLEDYQENLFFLGHKNAIKTSLTVYENLVYSPTLAKKSNPPKILSALKKVGLESKRNVVAGSLSAGQKQRLAISKLLLTDCKLWILDEPFSALDNSGIEWMQSLMLQHAHQDGMIIFTSHQPFSLDEKNYAAIKLLPALDEYEVNIAP